MGYTGHMPLIDHVLAGETTSARYHELLARATAAQRSELLELAQHPDPRVRGDLVSTLPFLDDPPEPAYVATAVRLTEDPDPTVRDHACFVLAQQWRDVDTPPLREALAARLDDLHRDTRCEALVGLAFRHDDRARPRVRAALSRPSGDVSRLELIAAGALGDPELHHLVLRHLDGWDDDATWVDAVRRLTDPRGPGVDLFHGVAELYAARAHGHPDPAASLSAWHLMSEMLDIAPDRAPAFFTATAARLSGDPAALHQLSTGSALATMLDLVEG